MDGEQRKRRTGAPAGLKASAGNAQITLSWSASAGATSYVLERGITSGGPYSQIGTATSVSYTDTGITNGTAYYYVVIAVNSAGQSAPSTEASATPDSMTTVPSVLGGAIFRTPDAAIQTTTIDRSAFIANTAPSGGALYLHNWS